MVFNNNYGNRPKPVKESKFEESITETAGYRSAEEQIMSILNCGKRLVDKAKYDSDNENYTEEVDPTREPGFDLADLSKITNALEIRLKKVKTALKRKEAAEAEAKKADEKVRVEAPPLPSEAAVKPA